MSADLDRAGLWGSGRWPVVAGTLALMTCIAIESFAVTTVLPVVAADLDGLQWFSVAYAATITAALVGMVVGGSWADRVGVVIPLACGGGLFLLGIGMCALAPDMTTFVAGRFLQGLGGGIDSVVIYVVIGQHVPARLQTRMFGLLTAAWLVPSMAGPLIAGLVVEVLHWRIVFAAVLVGSAAALASLLASIRPQTVGGDVGARSLLPTFGGRGWYAIAAAGCLMGLHLGGQLAYPGSAVSFTVLVVVLVAVSTRLLPPGTLRARHGVARLVALRGLLGATVVATDVYLPLYLQAERGFSPGSAGLVIAIGASGWAVGAWLQGRPGPASSEGGPTLVRASALVVCGPVAALLFITGPVPVAGAVVGCVLMGIGMGMAYPRISAGVIAASQAQERGVNSSSLQASESMSTSAILAAAGVVLTLVSGSGGYSIVYASAVAVAVVASGVAWRSTRVG